MTVAATDNVPLMQFEDWAPTERLAEWTNDATEGLLATLSDFSDDDPRWLGPYLPIVNPPIWEIAHVAWFAEWFVLRQLHGRDPLMDHVDARYDSALVPHRTRWQLSYPNPAETRDYVRRVGDALIDVLRDDRGLDSTGYFVAYAISHHDAHTEALTYTRQTLEWGQLDESAPEPVTTKACHDVAGDLTVPGGTHILGGSRQQPFVMDNERWAHRIQLDSFDMAAKPVTMGQFGEFVEDGGYDNEILWSPEGWSWRQSNHVAMPTYWRRAANGWEHRRVSQWHPVEAHADLAMVHVSWWEAEAYCLWSGRRLPTEAEWEVAATYTADGNRRTRFPWGDRDPVPAEAALDATSGGTVDTNAHSDGDGPWGHRQLIGNIWEWTSTAFAPYPHFEPDAYRDNSEPWFYSRKVLRGGSWATRNRYVRSTFRNYFEPERQDVIAGFRTCSRTR